MTTTIPAHGGGAQPARIDTSGKVTGGAAMRVYGFASEAEALAAGFVCEGGPAMSVAIITDAQIASGEWKLDGDPFAVVIYTAPDSLPTEGGFAVPVYPVNGWGSAPAPAGDPIGDALRADAVAYWKMDESPNGTRVDATGHGYDLPEHDLVNVGPVASAIGKVGNCAVVTDNVSGLGPAYLNLAGEHIPISADGATVAAWVKRNEWTAPADGQEIPILDMDFFGLEALSGNIGVSRPNFGAEPHLYGLNYNPAYEPRKYVSASLASNTFVFCVFWLDRVAGTLNLQINNGSVISDISGNLETYEINRFLVGSGFFMNDTDAVYVDEIGVWNRLLSIDEIAYLYNSGAGRTLYP